MLQARFSLLHISLFSCIFLMINVFIRPLIMLSCKLSPHWKALLILEVLCLLGVILMLKYFYYSVMQDSFLS